MTWKTSHKSSCWPREIKTRELPGLFLYLFHVSRICIVWSGFMWNQSSGAEAWSLTDARLSRCLPNPATCLFTNVTLRDLRDGKKRLSSSHRWRLRWHPQVRVPFLKSADISYRLRGLRRRGVDKIPFKRFVKLSQRHFTLCAKSNLYTRVP